MRAHVDDRELVLAMGGELPPRRRSRVAAHLESCAACQARADQFRSAVSLLAAAPRAQRTPAEHAHARLRLEVSLNAAAAEPRVPAWSGLFAAVRLASPLTAAGVAAMAVAVGAAALVAMRAPAPPAATQVLWGALPDSSLTPGAVSSITAAELCNGVRPSRLVTEDVRVHVVRAYGMEGVAARAYELDALVTPELGGSTDAANLWPQRYHSPVWNAKVKDELERLLPELVCDGQITLAQAQHDIASDWIAAYRRYFKTDLPLQAHLESPDEEDAELVFVPHHRAPVQLASFQLASR